MIPIQKKSLFNISFSDINISVQTTKSLQTYISGLNLKSGIRNKIYILTAVILDKNSETKTKDNFVKIHSNLLIKLFGSEYFHFINYCIEQKIIKTKNNYLTASKYPISATSKKYGIYDKFLNSEITTIKFQDVKISKRLNKIIQTKGDISGDIDNTNKSYKQLTKEKINKIFENTNKPFETEVQKKVNNIMLRNLFIHNEQKTRVIPFADDKFKPMYNYLNQLSFDIPGARQFLKQNKNNLKPKQKRQIQDVISFFSKNKLRYIKQDRQGRLYTIVTLMPKVMRQFLKLKYNNKDKLIIADVSNFQPYILNDFIKQYDLSDNKDAKQWYNLTSKGQIYGYITNLYNKKYHSKTKQSTIKKRLISIINSRVKGEIPRYYFLKKTKLNGDKIFLQIQNKKTKLYLLLEKKFPSIIKTLKEMKVNNYKDASINLHKFESGLMINDIALNFATSNFCLTIHDAIICKLSDLPKLKKVLNFNFGLHFSKLPGIKITNLKGEIITDIKTNKTNKILCEQI